MVTAERTTAHPASGRTTADAYAARFGRGGEGHTRLAASGETEEIATPLTADAARAHLRGEASIGLYLRDGQDRATVGLVAHDGYRTAYDDDGRPHRAPEDGIAALQEARQRLALQGIDAAVERAPRGGRLWVFTSEPVPSEDLHALLRMATRGQEVEVYPRPERDEAAQQPVRAPLGVHPDDGRRYGFVDRAGRPLGATLVAQVEHLDSVRRVDVGRELGARPHLRDELAALDSRGPAPALAEPQERQPEQPEQLDRTDRTERMAPAPSATRWARKGDRTTEAVQAQLAGMGAERYDIGVYDRRNDAMLLRREWTPAQVEAAVGWFKGMNAQGRDIYIRPTGSSGLYIVDDVPAATVERMRAEGYTPAAVVETSPGNLQAWVRVSDTPLSTEEGTAVACDLAARYDGDMSSANWRHMGRLAGFTNRKEEHTQPDGRHPYARLHNAGGERAPEAPAILDRARAQATQSRRAGAGERDGAEPPRDQAAGREAFTRPPAGAGPVSPLGREYAHRARRLLERYPNAALTDLHRLDWMVTRDLARTHPEADKEALMRAIQEGSPRIDERKKGHVYNYAERTTRYVLMDPDVERVRGEATRTANRERDRWF
jgi:hypothetical protein